MNIVDFLHHGIPPTWAGIEPATLGVEVQRQIYYVTQPIKLSVLKICLTQNGDFQQQQYTSGHVFVFPTALSSTWPSSRLHKHP
ncbi:hypothetical protein TNCV_2062531 [Trichonephila clavipes]|nr:hypothetical protein TNCV_2062531 [Trichonephila clavipes]